MKGLKKKLLSVFALVFLMCGAMFVCASCEQTPNSSASASNSDSSSSSSASTGDSTGGSSGEDIPHVHSWGEWAVTVAATCTETGEETRVCSTDSTHTESRTVESTGHKDLNDVCENCNERKKLINWVYDADAVTVTANDYEDLPAKVWKDTEVFFTVTVKTGYELGPLVGAKKQDDGSYRFIVGEEDWTVKIKSSKTLNGITISKTPSLNYVAGQTVNKDDIEVVANYALGDEVITDYTINYANSSTFEVGDTYFIVTFFGKSAEVRLKTPVKPPWTFERTGLKLDNDENPVLVITGIYNTDDDKAALKAVFEEFFILIMENKTWALKEFTTVATVNDDKSFTIELTIFETTSGNQYFVRNRSFSDFSCANVDTVPVIAADGTRYYLSINENWSDKPVFLHVVK